MAQTVIRAAESTENIPSARRVRDVQKAIAYVDPDAAPFLLISMKSRKRTAINSKFEWIEKDLPARWDQVNNGAGYTSGDTAIVVDNAAYFSVGDLVNVPRTAEKVRVTAVVVATNTLTIVRSVGGTAAAALVDNDDLQIIGSAHPEGDTSIAEKSHQETYPFNYTQILRLPFGVTGTQDVSENYTGKDRVRLRREKLIEHKIDLERSITFGEREIDTSDTAKPRRYMGGFLHFATENIKDASGTLTEPEMEDFCEDIFSATGGGSTRVLLSSPLVVSTIDMLAVGRLHVVPKDESFGMSIKQWVTSHGTLLIIKHRLLENGAGGNGYAGYALGFDPKKVVYVHLRERDTKLRMDIQANDLDGWKDEYLTEASFQLENPKVHGILKGVTG